ncbi:LLM class flavin-dependent oxidoreductase [Brevibacterium aurantiacum]|uniref:LLM class flavin-dependent oxidoreductase n=1 Tax=Brevibacterium aurantiacum TaxID=273384 RepID=A0A556CD55_BREAU|nr:LLM class flavin-dependent oxidoreductase [Brevibacterium aurantiacum]
MVSTQTTRPLDHLGFIHLVPFDRRDPARGLQEGIELFRFAEELGLDSGWVRTRHMQYGLPSPAVYFAALAQHTRRIGLGSAVIPVGHENPYRLAEDLAVADVLSGGRVLPGLSVHPPTFTEEVNDLVFDEGWSGSDFSYRRIERLRDFLAGAPVREKPEYQGFGGDIDSERVEPNSPGLSDRLWYGGGSLKSATWAGGAGLNWLMSNISSAEDGIEDFSLNQANQIQTFRKARTGDAGADGSSGEGRVSIARVIVPTDGASPHQVRRYRDYAEARTPRTKKVHGKNTIIATDVLGSNEEIVDRLLSDPAFAQSDDYLFELPFEFELEDWRHILHQLATEIGPKLGWAPTM